MNLPKTTCKQRHQDRQRIFIGEKVQGNLDKILEMRFDPTFTTDITISATSDYKLVNREWERYQLHLQTKATLLASIEGFSLLQDKIKPVPTGGVIPPTNMIFDDIPTAEDLHPSFVSIEHTHNNGLNNCVYSYPDQSSFEKLTAIAKTGGAPFKPTAGNTVTLEDVVQEYQLDNLSEIFESPPSGKVTPELLQHVGNLMITSGHLDCSTAATLSVAINLPLIAPICRRKRLRNMRVKVRTLVDDRLPQVVLDEEKKKKQRPTFAIGAYYNSCSAVNKKITYEWDILRFCPCAVLVFKDLCEAFKNETFSRWFYQYYAMLRTSLTRRA